MPRMPIAVANLVGCVGDAKTDLPGTVGDPANNNYAQIADGDLLTIRNTTGGALNVTVVVVGDSLNRELPGTAGNLAISVPANGLIIMGPLTTKGWAQKGPLIAGQLFINGASASLLLQVLRP